MGAFLGTAKGASAGHAAEDESAGEGASRLVRVLGLARILWGSRGWVAGGTLAGTLLGAAYSLLAPEVFVSRAIIYPKEVSATSEKSLWGGSLNPLAGVSHLGRVDILLKSPEVAAIVLRREETLPALFPERRDSTEGRWLKKPPLPHEGLDALRNALHTKVDSYKLTIELSVRAGNAKSAHLVLSSYLDALNERMKETVIRDAEANREYLESQLSRTYDPWLRDKIQQLILRQVETGMLLNANAFEVLEGPSLPRLRETPRRKRIVLSWTLAAFAVTCAGVLAARSARRAAAAARSA